MNMNKLLVIAALISQSAFAQVTFDGGKLNSMIPENHRQLIAVGLSTLNTTGEIVWWDENSGGTMQIEKFGSFNGNKCATFTLKTWGEFGKELVKQSTYSACLANGKWSVLF